MILRGRSFAVGVGIAVGFALVESSVGAVAPVYPEADWAKGDPARHGFDPSFGTELDAYAFAKDAPFTTDGLLVLHGGEILYERYARDYTAKMRHYAWSMTKSVSMALFGIAEGEGKIRRDDPISKWVPEADAKSFTGVTIANLISMSTGILWREGYEASPFDSHVVTALYRTRASFDFGLYRTEITKRVAPVGERFNYASGETNLMMKALGRSLGPAYADFPWNKLFTPIGMKSAVFERDGSGNFVGSSYLEATPRDFARFGYLFLRDGNWRGKQIVPAEWVKMAATPSPAMAHLRLDHRPADSPYGYGWWLNRAFPRAQIGKPFPSFPDDMYFASGHDGQELVVVPSWDVVVVRVGNDRFGKRLDLERIGKILKDARAKSAPAKGSVR
ncbi:MAG: serine hydrolase [Bdellovibrionales bacterium]|nr:serine hydrolase [Bdellovibrionales bacterium]